MQSQTHEIHMPRPICRLDEKAEEVKKTVKGQGPEQGEVEVLLDQPYSRIIGKCQTRSLGMTFFEVTPF